ncbi:MAG: hypothetical protein GTO14_18830 [Anaerolineales bacterium]|nr:hypothetical protein [Anaerolineales bacterium]
MRDFRILILSILVGLLLTITIPAGAQCSEDDPDCPIEPPQSQEIDTDSNAGDGLEGEAASPGALTPVESVPPPLFLKPAPFFSRHGDAT